jgi:hypothetical protein
MVTLGRCTKMDEKKKIELIHKMEWGDGLEATDAWLEFLRECNNKDLLDVVYNIPQFALFALRELFKRGLSREDVDTLNSILGCNYPYPSEEE